MAKKSITLVTGANRGIGFEVFRQRAQPHNIVLLGSRDLAKGEEATTLGKTGCVRQ